MKIYATSANIFTSKTHQSMKEMQLIKIFPISTLICNFRVQWESSAFVNANKGMKILSHMAFFNLIRLFMTSMGVLYWRREHIEVAH